MIYMRVSTGLSGRGGSATDLLWKKNKTKTLHSQISIILPLSVSLHSSSWKIFWILHYYIIFTKNIEVCQLYLIIIAFMYWKKPQLPRGFYFPIFCTLKLFPKCNIYHAGYFQIKTNIGDFYSSVWLFIYIYLFFLAKIKLRINVAIN